MQTKIDSDKEQRISERMMRMGIEARQLEQEQRFSWETLYAMAEKQVTKELQQEQPYKNDAESFTHWLTFLKKQPMFALVKRGTHLEIVKFTSFSKTPSFIEWRTKPAWNAREWVSGIPLVKMN